MSTTTPRPDRRRRRRPGRRTIIGVITALFVASTGSGVAQASSPDIRYATSSAAASTVSADWAGWEVTGGTYTSVSASWRVPTVTCGPGETSYSAHWVGLDGDGSDSVEQIGTSSDCDSGTAAYSAWYEFYPAASVRLSVQTVRAGDAMTASVTSVPGSDGSYRLVLTDATRHWTKTVTGQAPQARNASAEIISEAPSDGRSGNVLPLADFQRQRFTDVTVNGRPLSSTTGLRRVELADRSGTPMATVSAVSAGNGFTVTWESSGSGTGSGTGFGSVPPGSDGGTGGSDPWAFLDGWGYPTGGSAGSSPGAPTGTDSVGAATGAGDPGSSAFGWGGDW